MSHFVMLFPASPAREPICLTVGADAVTVETLDDTIVERRVPLPDRWLRALAEVQVISSTMVPLVRLEGPSAAMALDRLASTATGSSLVGLRPSVSGVGLGPPSNNRPAVSDLPRLAATLRLVQDVKSLTILVPPPSDWSAVHPGASAYVLELDRATPPAAALQLWENALHRSDNTINSQEARRRLQALAVGRSKTAIVARRLLGYE